MSSLPFRRAAIALAALFVCGPAWAADPVKVKAGGFADLKVEVPKSGAVTYKFSTPPVQKAAKLEAGRMIFGCEPGKTCTVTVTTIAVDFDKKTIETSEEDYVFEFEPTTVVTPPPKKPTDPVVPPATALYFLVVKPDGPTQPATEAILRLAAWDQLRAAGHKVGVASASEASGIYRLPAGTVLPVVVTLRVEGNTSVFVRGPVPLPATEDAVLKLPVSP